MMQIAAIIGSHYSCKLITKSSLSSNKHCLIVLRWHNKNADRARQLKAVQNYKLCPSGGRTPIAKLPYFISQLIVKAS